LATRIDSKDWDVFYRAGTFWILFGSRKDGITAARTNFEEAVRLAPRSPLAHLGLGECLLLEGYEPAASQEFEKSLGLRRTAIALSSIGSAYLSTRRYAVAAEFFEKAVAADPSRYTYHINAGKAYRGVPNGGSRAEEHFRLALSQTEGALADADIALVRAYHGVCQAALGQAEAARADFARIVGIDNIDKHTLAVVRDGFEILGDREMTRTLDRQLAE
jgi:tetratricopeptide (TPR) repeat protein